MSRLRIASASAGLLCAALSAQAGVISFNFAPPTGGGLLTSIASAGATPDSGLMFADQSVPLNFTLDASSEGLGVVNFPNARMFMTMSISPARDLGGGFFSATLSGAFTIYDYTGGTRNDIITGTVTQSQFLKVGASHLMLMNSNNSLTYTAGSRLTSLLGANKYIAPSHDGTFALSNVRTLTGNPEIIRPNLTFDSFTAVPAFTGSTNVVTIPAPGAWALAGLGGFIAARRRRG
jgi:hypothetical protein